MTAYPRSKRQVFPDAPPFEVGDHFTPDEFVRRWDFHPEITTAELIRGIAYIFPHTTVDHGDTHADVGSWLCMFRIATKGVESGSRASLFLGDDILQPDVHMRIVPGGMTWVEQGFLYGPPELVAEICYSAASHDLHVKRDIYEAAGVREYIAYLLFEKELRWHHLVDGSYQVLASGPDGIHRSHVFPGLWLDGHALLKRDMAKVLAVLQSGLASTEHQAFIEQLAKKRAGG